MRCDPTMAVLAERINDCAKYSALLDTAERLLMHRACGMDFQQDYDDLAAEVRKVRTWGKA